MRFNKKLSEYEQNMKDMRKVMKTKQGDIDKVKEALKLAQGDAHKLQ